MRLLQASFAPSLGEMALYILIKMVLLQSHFSGYNIFMHWAVVSMLQGPACHAARREPPE
jgi:hypothetical protein